MAARDIDGLDPGEEALAAAPENHARSCGVPEPQLDWEE
jgi:hypothetical protein